MASNKLLALCVQHEQSHLGIFEATQNVQEVSKQLARHAFSIRVSGSKRAGLSLGIMCSNAHNDSSEARCLESESRLWSNFASFFAMLDPDLKTTLREFKEYVDLSYEPTSTIAARIGIKQATIGDWLSGRHPPKATSLAKLRRFLDAEAKRPLQGDGIRPIETVPYKITKPIQRVRYARPCPFCRKERARFAS